MFSLYKMKCSEKGSEKDNVSHDASTGEGGSGMVWCDNVTLTFRSDDMRGELFYVGRTANQCLNVPMVWVEGRSDTKYVLCEPLPQSENL